MERDKQQKSRGAENNEKAFRARPTPKSTCYARGATHLFAQSGGLLAAPDEPLELEAVRPVQLVVAPFAAEPPGDGPGLAGLTVFYGFPINIK